MSNHPSLRPLHALAAAALVFSGSALFAQEATPVPGDPSAAAMPAPSPAATFVAGRMINMRAGEKRPLALKDNERNPYAKRSAEEEVNQEEGSNAEELRIREQLSRLRVTGRSHGPNGLRVLLGDIILEEGAVLPQLLEDQSENLRVVELSEDTVVLGWLDIETKELTGKSMQVAYDLSPSVSIALQGQIDTGEDEEGIVMRRMGVLRIGQERKKSESGMAARESSNPIPPEVFKAGQ
jgi:hypothetical protein